MARFFRPKSMLLGLLALSWPVMLALMWQAFWTVPPPEVLEQTRFVQPPTFGSLRHTVLLSAAELAALALWLWPGRHYVPRLLFSPILLSLYFIFTTPLGLTTVDQVHRRWLALWILLLGLIALLVALRSVVRWYRTWRAHSLPTDRR
jgi:hypothetical protein